MSLQSLAKSEELARQRLMMTTPSAWPLWPFLPVLRRSDRGLELGVMFDAREVCDLTGYSAAVFRTSLYFPPMTLAEFLNLPREVFDTCEELLHAGWRVD